MKEKYYLGADGVKYPKSEYLNVEHTKNGRKPLPKSAYPYTMLYDEKEPINSKERVEIKFRNKKLNISISTLKNIDIISKLELLK